MVAPLTFPELLARSVRLFGPREVLGTLVGRRFQWIHYRELGALVERARRALWARSVRPGDRVAVIANNRVEWAVLSFAVHSLGAVYVPMYEAQAPSEWEFILADAEVKLAFAAGARAPSALRELRSRLPHLEGVVGFDEEGPESYGAFLTAAETVGDLPDATPDRKSVV